MTQNIKKILKEKSNDYSDLEERFFKENGASLMFDSCLLGNMKNSSNRLSVSVVIPAWNAENTIINCLTAIEKSSFNKKYSSSLEVVVTDDGSTDNTLNVLKASELKLNLTIIHQDNHGQGPAMNAGISVAKGDIILEVDSDTILNYHAIENIMCRHEFYKDALYTGFRSYVDKDDKRVNLKFLQTNGPEKKFELSTDERINYFNPGWPENMCITSDNYKRLGNSNGLWMPDNNDNTDPWLLADMVFGMTFSLPRDIFNFIGGFDDRFKGWGCDDGFVGAKAISAGVFVIPVYPATGLHISHPFRTQDRQTEYDFNRKFFFEFTNSTKYEKHPDWITLANKRIKNKFVKKNAVLKEAVLENVSIVKMTVDQLVEVGRYEEAYKILSVSKTNSLSSDLSLSKTLIGMKMYDKCFDLLDRALKTNKNNLDLMFQLSMTYVSIGRFDMARSLLQDISKINSDYPKLKYWLYRDSNISFGQGMRYYNQKFYSIAKNCFGASIITNFRHHKALKYWKKCSF